MKKICLLLIFLISCKPQDNIVTKQALGTICSVFIPQEKSKKVSSEIFKMLKVIDKTMSKHLEGSDVYKINNDAFMKKVSVSDDTYYLIKESKKYSEISNSMYDISIGPLVKLWGFSYDSMKVPSKNEINETLNLINYKNIKLSENNNVLLQKKAMMVDLGAIAKGFATDKAVNILKYNEIKSALLDFGGNIYAFGKKPNNENWKIGLQDPFKNQGAIVGILEVENKAVVTSGTYERFFIENNKRYHHILNPKTGYPVENGLVSVTIISKNATEADAFSTSIFLLGLKNGLELLKNHKDVYAIFIDENRKVYLSENFNLKFNIIDKSFILNN